MATIKEEVVSFFRTLTNAENVALGLLDNPGVPVVPYYSFLDSISIDNSKSFMYYRLPQNPSFGEAYTSDLVFRHFALKRDVAFRKMTRAEYYSNASSEFYDEILRLDRAKINVIQHLAGSAPIQSGTV